jgi:hypothetical protein
MAPDRLILTAISKEDKNEEIQRRLQDFEIQKARNLLAMVMGHKQALDIAKDIITKQIMDLSKTNGNK